MPEVWTINDDDDDDIVVKDGCGVIRSVLLEITLHSPYPLTV